MWSFTLDFELSCHGTQNIGWYDRNMIARYYPIYVFKKNFLIKRIFGKEKANRSIDRTSLLERVFLLMNEGREPDKESHQSIVRLHQLHS